MYNFQSTYEYHTSKARFLYRREKGESGYHRLNYKYPKTLLNLPMQARENQGNYLDQQDVIPRLLD
ncbi:MAG: hypothetical protein V7K62_15250 [Nostoc sp.]